MWPNIVNPAAILIMLVLFPPILLGLLMPPWVIAAAKFRREWTLPETLIRTWYVSAPWGLAWLIFAASITASPSSSGPGRSAIWFAIALSLSTYLTSAIVLRSSGTFAVLVPGTLGFLIAMVVTLPTDSFKLGLLACFICSGIIGVRLIRWARENPHRKAFHIPYADDVAPCCIKCDYDLSALPGVECCPECGVPVNPPPRPFHPAVVPPKRHKQV